jgi:hypothetical protein
MARKRFAFDVKAAIKAAWDYCWANNIKTRANGDHYRPSTTYYLTSSDIEAQVRRFAEETAAGKQWGSTGRAYGKGYSTVRLSGNLLGAVRDWLHEECYRGRIVAHNFGKGHISGQRYRPAGEPVSEVEQRTFDAKAKRAATPRPVHLYCGHEQRKRFLCAQVKKPSFRVPRSQARCTSDAAKVTCPRCIKLMRDKDGKPAAGTPGPQLLTDIFNNSFGRG